MKKLGILGSGFLAGIVVRAWKNGLLPGYELVGICGRTAGKTAALAGEAGCKSCSALDGLLALEPEIVAECASVQAVREGAAAVLTSGADLIVLSIGAFADEDFYEKTASTARRNGRKVHLASGAIGGFDVLRTVCLMGDASASMETRKPPQSLSGTPVYDASLENRVQPAFRGAPVEAIRMLPTKVNVAVAASLATTGPERMDFTINSVPGFVGDDHRISAEVPGVHAVVDVYSSTSAIAGWSVVALLQNLDSPIQFS